MEMAQKENEVLPAGIAINSSRLAACATEYAEGALCPPAGLEGGPDRRTRWQELLKRHPGLGARILQANPSWEPGLIPDKAVELYNRMSALRHEGSMPKGMRN
ncbi:hypothetical protein ABPG75_004200 [Micractinium tetrahymenae]